MRPRATAMRKVMRESWKWRSGRARDRVVATRPSGLGGKTSGALGDEEGEAGERTTDVMWPAGVRASLEVVEAHLALEILVRPLGAPALLDATNQILPGHGSGERGEHVVLRWCARSGFLDDEPLLFAAHVTTGDDADTDGRESCRKRASAALSPGDLSIAAGTDDVRDGLDTHRVRFLSVVAHDDDAGVTLDVERVFEAECAHAVPERTDVAVRAVSEHEAERYALRNIALDEVESDAPLRSIFDVVWEVRSATLRPVLGPGLRQVQVHVNGQMLGACGDRDARRDLTVPRFPERSTVLSLHSRRLVSLFRKAGVIDDPRLDLFARGHRVDGISCRALTDTSIRPRGDAHEMQQSIGDRTPERPIAAGTGRDRLDTLALALAEEPHGV